MAVRRALLVLLAACAAACSDPPPSHQAETVSVERLRFVLPPGWQRTEPSSDMRKFQARIPGAGGDAELALFHFGEGQGGDVADNIRRWIAQIEFEPGADTHREEFSANGMTVYWVNFSGTLKPSPMDPMLRERKPNSRLLAAVIEGPGGPWYFKAIGPDATLKPQRDAFLAMLESARPE